MLANFLVISISDDVNLHMGLYFLALHWKSQITFGTIIDCIVYDLFHNVDRYVCSNSASTKFVTLTGNSKLYLVQILIDEKKRNQYDWTLRHQENAGTSSGDNWAFNHEYDDGQRIYRWAYLRRKMQREKYWEQYHTEDDEVYDESEEENTAEERGSFVEVLRSAFLSLFLMQTVGTHLSLTFSSLMALLDRKLDTGYKVGYVFAWLLGGRSGILLTVFLSFASWVCGKTSSSIVAVVLVAMWFGSNLARYAPLPQGALLTLLYMSIKLQVDLN